MTKKRWPCPIEGCKYNAHKEQGLWNHLYMQHRKAELIRALTRGSLLTQGYEYLLKSELINKLLERI